MYYFEEENENSFGYLGTSTICHIALFLFCLTLKITAPEKPQIIEIEILPSKGEQMAVPLAMPKKSDTPQIAHRKSLPPKVISSKNLPTAKVSADPDFSTAENILKQDPIFTSTEFQDPNIDEAFEEIDKQSLKNLDKTKKQLSALSNQALLAHADSISEIKVNTERQLKKAATLAANRRANEIAQLKAEMAAAKAAAQAAAAREASRLAAANAARQAQQQAALAAESESDDNEDTSANRASGSPTNKALGTRNGVHALEDLRQYPGNRKPQYDFEDRLEKREGVVNILAYVSPQGDLTEFKMIRSSGHRSLDLKTLAAIKRWKFYSGQEGWVEIPIEWTLKGGPVELPATLRRKVSKN